MGKLKENKKILIIAVVALVVVVAGVIIAVSSTGDKTGKGGAPAKIENNQGGDSGNDGSTGGLQVVDPTKDDVEEDSTDVSGMFDDEKDSKDKKDDTDKKSDNDSKDSEDKTTGEDEWGEFY